MVVIVDYEVGNIQNVINAFKRINVETVLTDDKAMIRDAKAVVLPGVGAFKDAIDALKAKGLDTVLQERAAENKLTIGICLGMQLLFDRSFEDGCWEGLGIIKGDIIKFETDDPSLKIPHMGWNTLELKNADPIANDIQEESYVYFVHSYYASGMNPEELIMSTEYIVDTVPAVVRKGNIIGMQFHPEKSGDVGQQLLMNFKALVDEEA